LNEDKSSRYHRLRRRAALVSLAVDGALFTGLLASGASRFLCDRAASLTGGTVDAVSTVAIYSLWIALAYEAVALPLAFQRSYLLERRFGLSSESFATWLRDHAKATSISVIVGVAGAEAVYATMRGLPQAWWVASTAICVAALVVVAKAAPLVLLPLFYRFTPLDRPSLNDRLVDLARRAGVPAVGVYEWGLGEKSRRANAALVGTGATRRIIVSDTLLAAYSEDEIEVILAHELAHHVHRDILKGLAVEAVVIAASFFAAALALDAWWLRLGLRSPADVAGLPLLLLAGAATTLAATPIVNAISRAAERRADAYALRLTGRPAAFVSAMRRLATQNLAEEHPSRAALWLFYTHPPIGERIRSAAPGNS